MTEAETKTVAANQKAVDALPLDSGDWSVEGVMGLYVRCRKQTKSFWLRRRVSGKMVKETLGEMPVKMAREKAMRIWHALKPKPAAHGKVTLDAAIDHYLEEKKLADKTRRLYRYNRDRYLKDWRDRGLEDIGNDRPGFRLLVRSIRRKHGAATSNQVIQLVSAVYRWQRKIDPSLPETPTTSVEEETIPARDWAYSADELQAWWYAAREGKNELGVKTLGPIKRMWWLTVMFTGARKGSVEALRWRDLDFDKKRILFFVTKGDRPYGVPMSDKLAELLIAYRDGGEVPPSDWVFPSIRRDGEHLTGVKNDREGVGPAHRLRHTFRTTLAELGASSDQARLLMGHSMGGDVSRGYITAPLLIESLRPLANAAAEHYVKVIGLSGPNDQDSLSPHPGSGSIGQS